MPYAIDCFECGQEITFEERPTGFVVEVTCPHCGKEIVFKPDRTPSKK